MKYCEGCPAPKPNDGMEGIRTINESDIKLLIQKREGYGDSWKKRGGVGAYMNIVRKIDRIENQCKSCDYDIFKAIDKYGASLIDDLQDLSCYLLLIREEAAAKDKEQIAQSDADRCANCGPRTVSKTERTWWNGLNHRTHKGWNSES